MNITRITPLMAMGTGAATDSATGTGTDRAVGLVVAPVTDGAPGWSVQRWSFPSEGWAKGADHGAHRCNNYGHIGGNIDIGPVRVVHGPVRHVHLRIVRPYQRANLPFGHADQ